MDTLGLVVVTLLTMPALSFAPPPNRTSPKNRTAKKNKSLRFHIAKCKLQQVLPALPQKLVGEFFRDFLQGNLVRNSVAILQHFSDPQDTGLKTVGKLWSHFRKKIRNSKQSFALTSFKRGATLTTSAASSR